MNWSRIDNKNYNHFVLLPIPLLIVLKICILSNIAAIRRNNRTIHRWSKEMNEANKNHFNMFVFLPLYFFLLLYSMFFTSLCDFKLRNSQQVHSTVFSFNIYILRQFWYRISKQTWKDVHWNCEQRFIDVFFHSAHSISSTLTNKDKRVQGLDCDTPRE